MRIRHKILIGYLLVYLVFSVTAIAALYNLHRVQLSYIDLINHRVGLVNDTQELLLAFEFEALMMRSYLLTGKEEYKQEFKAQQERAEADLVAIESRLSSKDERAKFAKVSGLIRSFQINYAAAAIAIRDRTDLTDDQKLDLAIAWTLQQKGTVRAVIAAGNDFINYQRDLLDGAVETNEQWVQHVIETSVVLGLFAMILGVAAAVYISNTIAQPVKILEYQANKIATGDWRFEDFGIESQDEVGSLARSFQRMVGQLRQFAERVLNAADSTRRLAADLQASARNAAAVVASTTERISQVAGTIGLLAQRARDIAGVSSKASTQAENLEGQANRILEQMERSARIASRASGAAKETINRLRDVNRVIEYLTLTADQARLLAQRASAEARTRDGGTDFASLAVEMERRARQAVEAAGDISQHIQKAVEEAQKAVSSVEEDCRLVAEGRKIAKESLTAITEMVNQVHTLTQHIEDAVVATERFTALMGDVTLASEEQTRLVDGIAKATETLNEICRDLQAALGDLKV
ncbi:MAG: methyl-accepting chemotaxis protein [Bacillota bacterium]